MTLPLHLPEGRQALVIEPDIGGGQAVERPPGQVHLDLLAGCKLVPSHQPTVFPYPGRAIDVEKRSLVDAALDFRADRLN